MGEAIAGWVRVWDLPTRIFHWALVLCVAGAVVTAKVGGNAMIWHMRLGYAVLTLIAFRLLWGFMGGRWSRFSSILYGPGAMQRYLRSRPRANDWFEVGHNPLGTLSVLAMLLWLLLQVGSGLIADDEIATTGPLVRFVSNEFSLAWTDYHTSLGQWGLFALVGLHLAAIAYYRVAKKKDLISPMLHGDKQLPVGVPASRDSLAMRVLAMVLLGICAAAVYSLVNLGAG